MQRRNAEALLLEAVDLRDRDRIVTFLTAPYGKVRGVARGARRKYSRFSGQLQPLAKARIGWFEKEGRELVRITDVELLRPAGRMLATLEGILLGSYLADHMREFAQENEASEHLFRLLDSTLEALTGGVDPDLAARYYEVWMLRLGGLFPAPHECPLCGRRPPPGEAMALSGDALVCTECGGGGASPVTAPAVGFLRRTARESLPRMAEALPPAAVLNEVEQLCGRLRRSFLGRELPSYGVMKRTLGGLRA